MMTTCKRLSRTNVRKICRGIWNVCRRIRWIVRESMHLHENFRMKSALRTLKLSYWRTWNLQLYVCTHAHVHRKCGSKD